MKKNFVIVSVLALALLLSPLGGIGPGVSAGENATSAVVLSASGNQGSASGSDAAPTPAPAPETK